MSDLDARIEALAAELGRLREEQYADLKAAYFANDARHRDVAARFGMSRGQLSYIARKFGWPKRKKFQSAETRARRSATFKAKGIKPVKPFVRPRIRPLRGTDEYRLFRKIADGNGHGRGLGAAAAHAELRRGV